MAFLTGTFFRYASLIALACVFLSHGETHAHNNVDGYILGVVTLEEAPAAGARVVINHVGSGVSRTTETSASGAYRFSHLTPGVYEVTASAGGSHRATWKVTVNAGWARR